MQYSDRGRRVPFSTLDSLLSSFAEMSQMSFNHLLNLSLSFHMRRKTGEILRILDRGSAINRVFELLLFNIVPTFLDIIIALAIFVWKFDWELAVVVAFVMFSYSESRQVHYQPVLTYTIVSASIALTSWRTRLRRQMNDKDIVSFFSD